MSLLSVLDHVFLNLEKRRQPMHVGGLFLFKLPEDAGPDFVQTLIESIKNSPLGPVAPFDQVLSSLGFSWRKDEDFDLEHHFRHIALPRPGRVRELLAYVSQEHSALLDRAKPLWEIHVIEGIEGGRFALYAKIHHGLVDGVSAMKLVNRTFSLDQTSLNKTPIWSVGFKPKSIESPVSPRKKQSVLEKLKGSGHAIAVVSKEFGGATKQVFNDSEYTSIFTAPRSILNTKISASRRFSAQSYNLDRIKKVAADAGCTINDVILAMCSGALRQYLLNFDALPVKPLVAMVPVNVRNDASEEGNHISMILTSLATDKLNAVERLQGIIQSVNTSKERFARMSKGQIMGYSGLVFSLPGVNLLTGAVPSAQSFNVVISNVPGPKNTLYWNGAALDAMYPVSLIMDGQAINITLMSYRGSIEVGILACRKTLPKVQSLLSLLEDELGALEQMTQ